MFNLYATMNRHNENKDQKELDVIGHERFYQERSRSCYRKRKKKLTRRAQSAAELNRAAINAANKRVSFKARSTSTDSADSDDKKEISERTPLMAAQSLAKLLLNRSFSSSLKGGNNATGTQRKLGSRYQYSSLEVENTCQQAERVELERKARDHASIVCQTYLATSSRYSFLYHLNDIGSRYDKHWFIVNDLSVKTERVLTLVPKTTACPIECDATTRDIILDLFRSLQHPYIYPVLDIEFAYSDTDTYAVLVIPFNSTGSLKDLIYKSSWDDDWNTKYNERGESLPLWQIQRLGRQILEALLFLRERGFPPYGHLHCGNVMLQNGAARLTGLENTLLNLTSRIHPVVWSRAKSAPNAIDIISFGHILFEMAAGYELAAPQPTPGHLQLDLERFPLVVEVLQLIFDHKENRYPSLEELLLCDLFRNIDLREMRCTSLPPFQMRLSSPTRALLQEIKRCQINGNVKAKPRLSSSLSDVPSLTFREKSYLTKNHDCETISRKHINALAIYQQDDQNSNASETQFLIS